MTIKHLAEALREYRILSSFKNDARHYFDDDEGLKRQRMAYDELLIMEQVGKPPFAKIAWRITDKGKQRLQELETVQIDALSNTANQQPESEAE